MRYAVWHWAFGGAGLGNSLSLYLVYLAVGSTYIFTNFAVSHTHKDVVPKSKHISCAPDSNPNPNPNPNPDPDPNPNPNQALLADVIRCLGKRHALAIVGEARAATCVLRAVSAQPGLASFVAVRDPSLAAAAEAMPAALTGAALTRSVVSSLGLTTVLQPTLLVLDALANQPKDAEGAAEPEQLRRSLPICSLVEASGTKKVTATRRMTTLTPAPTLTRGPSPSPNPAPNQGDGDAADGDAAVRSLRGARVARTPRRPGRHRLAAALAAGRRGHRLGKARGPRFATRGFGKRGPRSSTAACQEHVSARACLLARCVGWSRGARAIACLRRKECTGALFASLAITYRHDRDR